MGYASDSDSIWNGIGCGKLYKDGVWAKIVEPEFVLPEKWYFKGTIESERWQKEVLENKTNVCLMRDKYYTHPISNNYKDREWIYLKTNPTDYTEITFEQFKKYVLKENTTEQIVENKPLFTKEQEE